ncbi:DedA family protein [Desulfovibrio inopinatus]|uniref:DedA family protein n=1 Tax=Desulfovibrio inopinatus TaxID=102109 RepID=UPI000684235F|nr:DedA family protein [Desulfovibrio inopinatus]
MFDQFTQVAATLSDSPVLQACLAAVSTLILEDPTTIGCGFLVAHGNMSYWAAFWGLFLGIAAGDFTLFMFGRFTASRLSKAGVTGGDRLAMIGKWFQTNIVFAVLAARVAPGTRMPTYIAAGASGANAFAFLATTIVASLVWTVILLNASIYFGENVLSELGPYKVPLAIVIVAGFIGLQWHLAKRRAKNAKQKKPPAASYFEFWPAWLFYIPVVVWSFWLGIRYRGWMLPTVVNPHIFSGGIIGESKSEILAQLPESTASYVAPWVVVRKTDTLHLVDQIEQAMTARGFGYPVVAKPDVGQHGDGVQPIDSRRQLQDYIAAFPDSARFLVQQRVAYEHEANVLYMRIPGEERGRICSLTLKRFPTVKGDGEKTLRELIMANERVRGIRKAVCRRFSQEALDTVVPLGESIRLVFTGSHRQGAQFRDSNNQITDEMTAVFDAIAASMPELWFCRFIIRFDTVKALKQGRDFLILDINGAAAEATHIWDPRTTLLGAYRDLFAQWDMVYRIGAKNRARGFKPMKWGDFFKTVKTYRRIAKRYPETM